MGTNATEVWLGTADVATILEKSESTVRRRVASGEYPARFEEGRYLIAKSFVDRIARRSEGDSGAPDEGPSERSADELLWDDLSAYPMLMTADEVAECVGGDADQIRKMMLTGQIGSVPYGKQRRVSRRLLHAYLATSAA